MSDISPATASVAYSQTASQPVLTGSSGSTNSGQNIDAVSQDFESVFLTQMLGAMFSGDDVTSYFGGGTAGDVYKSYMMNELGKSFAASGGIGIAASVKQELLRMQEVSPS